MKLLDSGLPTGIGTDEERTQATAWIRNQPWYQNMLKAWGLPATTGDVKLNDQQRQALLIAAQHNGIAIPDGQQINENGQIAKDPSHLWRNIAIGAAIGGLALTGLGAAGIGPLAGAFGAGGAAADAAGVTAADGGFGVGGLSASSLGIGMSTPEALALAAPGAVAGEGLAGGGAAIGTGSKIAGLLTQASKLGGGNGGNGGNGITGGMNDPRGSAYAQQAQALTNNRFLAAKTDQAGPASDAQAFRNAMRAGLVAKMDPNAAPLSLNGHALPSLVNGDTTGYADTMFKNLAARQAAGKSPTEFGVPDPTQEELDAQAKAADAAGIGNGLNSKIADVTGAINTGARMASLGKNYWDIGKNIAGLF